MHDCKPLAAALGLAAALVSPLAHAQEASVADHVDARSPVTLGLSVGGSRYDNDYQSYYQATFVPSVAVQLDHGVALEGAMPFTGGFTPNSSCCRYGLGNATVGVRYRAQLGQGFELTVPGSVSLPTASAKGESRRNNLYTATAELSRDAGLYLPDTVSARMAAEVRYRRNRWSAMLGLGTSMWSTSGDDGRESTVVVPGYAEVGWRVIDSLTPTLGIRAIANPGAEQPVAASAEAGASYRRGPVLYQLKLAVPVDRESRERNLLSILGALSWRI
ncbi:MAG: hypothetical protein KJO07_07275 [Deltaproteobacteria bacterium]|nr:hypothetical protein [Deltaproteobacteria bacterium]